MANIKCQGENKPFNTELINALKKIKTKWKSAENENKRVRYHVDLPVFYYQKEYVTNRVYNMFGEKKVDAQKVFDIVDQPAEFIGGTAKFRNSIKNELKNKIENYPFESVFIIEIAGNLSDIEIVGSNTENNEMIRNLILNNKDKWNPAKIDGQKVRSRYKMKFP